MRGGEDERSYVGNILRDGVQHGISLPATWRRAPVFADLALTSLGKYLRSLVCESQVEPFVTLGQLIRNAAGGIRR